MKFVGFALIELIKAVTLPDEEKTHSYEVKIYDKHGRERTETLTMQQLKRDWMDLRMKEGKPKYAILEDTYVDSLSSEEFTERLTEWKRRSA